MTDLSKKLENDKAWTVRENKPRCITFFLSKKIGFKNHGLLFPLNQWRT
jgi:hypothetical protein